MANRLELTWVGKENRPRVEPRVLLEEASQSFHAPEKVSENDLFDNRLIFGDNLLGLKSLEQEFTGKIRCVFIDPPYNTGSAFEHYEDGLEHSIWLSMMRDRLEMIRRLMSDDGSLWITIDDNEAHYLKVLCDVGLRPPELRGLYRMAEGLREEEQGAGLREPRPHLGHREEHLKVAKEPAPA